MIVGESTDDDREERINMPVLLAQQQFHRVIQMKGAKGRVREGL